MNSFPSTTPALLAAMYGPMLELMPDAGIIIDPLLMIVAANGQAQQMFGHMQDLLGKSVGVLIPEYHARGHAQKVAAVFQCLTGRPMGLNLYLRGLRHNGDEFPVEISAKPMTNEHGSFALAVIRDASLRVETEEKLRFFTNHDPLTGLNNRACLTGRL